MAGKIIVGNVRKPVPEGFTPVYIGRCTSYRATYGDNFSLLGNPYPVPRFARQEAVARYRPWITAVMHGTARERGAVLDLIRRLQAGEDLALMCFCAPQACHGDVLKAVIEGALKDCAAAPVGEGGW